MTDEASFFRWRRLHRGSSWLLAILALMHSALTFRRGVGWVHRVAGVDVDEDRRGLRQAQSLDGGKGGVAGHEDLVARLHAERAKGEPQARGRRTGEDRVPDARVAGEFRLEGAALGSEDVLTRVDDGQDGVLDLLVDGGPGQRDRARWSRRHAPGEVGAKRWYCPRK